MNLDISILLKNWIILSLKTPGMDIFPYILDRSIRFYELDGELLLCNDFTWTERRSTDGASTSKITILLTLMVLFILFA